MKMGSFVLGFFLGGCLGVTAMALLKAVPDDEDYPHFDHEGSEESFDDAFDEL